MIPPEAISGRVGDRANQLQEAEQAELADAVVIHEAAAMAARLDALADQCVSSSLDRGTGLVGLGDRHPDAAAVGLQLTDHRGRRDSRT